MCGFGTNDYGELGIGETPRCKLYKYRNINNLPVLISDLKDVDDISAGSNHSLILKDNIIYAFGCNRFGQLGINNKTDSAIPLPLHFEASL